MKVKIEVSGMIVTVILMMLLRGDISWSLDIDASISNKILVVQFEKRRSEIFGLKKLQFKEISV